MGKTTSTPTPAKTTKVQPNKFTVTKPKSATTQPAQASPKAQKPAPKYKITRKTIAWALAMLLWVGIALTISQYLVSTIMVWILGLETVVQPVWSTIYSAIVYILCLALVILVPWKLLKMKTRRDELGLTGLPTWTDIGLAPVGFMVFIVMSIILVAIFTIILPSVDWSQAQDVGFQNLISTGDKILAFVALVIIAPIAEEIIFRGWLYGKLRARIPAWLGIILVSILFGIMHGQWNVAVNVFCMSVVMCLLREITGTIWSGILLHMIKNGVAFYFLFINPIIA